jgi:hypothetical protein
MWIGMIPARQARRSPHVEVNGFTVFYDTGIEEPRRSAALDRLTYSLWLIDRFDHRRLTRLQRGGTAFWLTTISPIHGYSEAGNLIVMSLRGIERSTREQLPMSIVHEATHARFATAGLLHNCGNMERMERRCVEEEIAFIRRLPIAKPEELHAWEVHKRATLKTRWWTLGSRLRLLWRTRSQSRTDTP